MSCFRPVAIGDPKTPTPHGGFAILRKEVNPIYVSNKSGQRKELSGPTSPIGDRYLAFHRNGRGEFGIVTPPVPLGENPRRRQLGLRTHAERSRSSVV